MRRAITATIGGVRDVAFGRLAWFALLNLILALALTGGAAFAVIRYGVLLIPDGVDTKNPAPAVPIWHQHNGEYHLGKNEPAGLAGIASGVWASAEDFLAAQGEPARFEPTWSREARDTAMGSWGRAVRAAISWARDRDGPMG